MNIDKTNLENNTPALSKDAVIGSVFLAFMRIDFEGIHEPSMKLFKKKKDADKHLDELKKIHGTWLQTYEIFELHCH